MSQYLAKFYCGNTRGLCNYNEPLDYSKLLDRNYDSEILKLIDDCKGKEFEKGYCCDPNNKELQKPMDDEYMEKINQKFEQNIFKKNNQNQFYEGQIPLVKSKMIDNKLSSIEICNCGGDSMQYKECIQNNCKDFKPATRYEYCKIGKDLNKPYCVIDKNNKDGIPQEVCNLRLKEKDGEYIHSDNFKINNFYPDCYINKCLKDPKLQVLDDLVHSNTNSNSYYKLTSERGNSLESYKFYKNKSQLNKDYKDTIEEDKSLLKYFS